MPAVHSHWSSLVDGHWWSSVDAQGQRRTRSNHWFAASGRPCLPPSPHESMVNEPWLIPNNFNNQLSILFARRPWSAGLNGLRQAPPNGMRETIETCTRVKSDAIELQEYYFAARIPYSSCASPYGLIWPARSLVTIF